jgi:hypothetical protein
MTTRKVNLIYRGTRYYNINRRKLSFSAGSLNIVNDVTDSNIMGLNSIGVVHDFERFLE